MNKEEFRETLYAKVDGLPAEYAIKYVISDLIDEIYDLKVEVQQLRDYNSDKELDELNYWYGSQ